MDQLIDKLIEGAPHDNIAVFVYGSSAINEYLGRDLDVIAISPDIVSVESAGCVVRLGGQKRTVKLYHVPDEVFLQDVSTLEYGGYYAHKFALSFKEIWRTGKALDAPLVFWKFEHAVYLARKGREPTAETLIKSVHYNILMHRPTFARPLAKFVDTSDRWMFLCRYVQEHVIQNAQALHPLDSRLLGRADTRKEKEAFYRFWLEYNRRKGCDSLWSDSTFEKMKLSCNAEWTQKIREYLNCPDSDLS